MRAEKRTILVGAGFVLIYIELLAIDEQAREKVLTKIE